MLIPSEESLAKVLNRTLCWIKPMLSVELWFGSGGEV